MLRAEEKWTEFRNGPFRVLTNAGDKTGRERLMYLEQFRYTLGMLTGKQDLKSFWPIRVLVFKNAKEYGPYATPAAFSPARDTIVSAWMADAPFPRDWLRAAVRLFLEANVNRMPASIEKGLEDVMSTVVVNGTRVTLGGPLPPGERSKDWARLQFLATDLQYAGRLRVMISNLEQGADLNTACRNAFEKTAAEIDRQVDAYLAAGQFETNTFGGRAVNPAHDFGERPLEPADLHLAFADLLLVNPARAADARAAYKALTGPGASEGLGLLDVRELHAAEAYQNLTTATDGGSKSARAWLALGMVEKEPSKARTDFEKAGQLNAAWAEPHFRLAQTLPNPLAKAKELKTAATLEPRNAIYWQALAETDLKANQFADAAKAWTAAEHASATEAERARIHQARLDVESQRADFEEAERKRRADEEARDLQRIKDAAAAEVHAAEQATNRRLNPTGQEVKGAVKWWDKPKGDHQASGQLIRVDCLNGPARLTIQTAPRVTIQLLISDPKQITIDGEKTLICGPQAKPRKVEVQYNARPDGKFKTAGDVLLISFP